MKRQIFVFFMFASSLIVLQSCSKRVVQAMTQRENHLDTPVKEEPRQVVPPQVIAGGQISNLPGEDESYQPLGGFQAGFIMPITRINEFRGFRAELNGSIQGANYEEDYGLKGKVSLFYINVPLVIRYQFKSGFFGEAGFQTGFCVSAKDKYSGTTYNYTDHINTFDFGIPWNWVRI